MPSPLKGAFTLIDRAGGANKAAQSPPVMVNGEVIAYNIASLLCALFVLERGADVFIDNTVMIAQRTRIPQPAIALLTAGAEWEELAVVIISIARNRSSLAIGNVVGSTISNILGAFSLGLLFYKNPTNNPVLFEQSSTIYTALLFLVTAIASALLAFGHGIDWKAVGGCFIGLFAVYIASISYLIAKGLAKAPEELSDDDSVSDDTEDEHGDDSSDNENQDERDTHQGHHELANSLTANPPMEATLILNDLVPATLTDSGVTSSVGGSRDTNQADNVSDPSIPRVSSQFEMSAVLGTIIPGGVNTEQNAPTTGPGQFSCPRRPSLVMTSISPSTTAAPTGPVKHRSLVYHAVLLGAGFIAIVLSGYVLSNATSNIVDEFGISDVLAGVVILSIATTIPEKFVAVLSGYKGHMDIMLANTVGSNVFLLTLCIGITWVATGGSYEGGDIVPAEIAVMFGSTVALAVTVLLQGRFARIIGVGLLSGYVAFIGLEFTVIHKV